MLFFQSLNALNNKNEIQACTIEKGVVLKQDGETIQIKREEINKYVSKIYFEYGILNASKIKQDQIAEFFKLFDQNTKYTENTYRKIKKDPKWREIYDVKSDDNYKWKNPKSGMEYQEKTDIVFCRGCGVLMPLKLATVDHQKPQTGGDVEAVCRVFRAFGLTKSPPSSNKSKVFFDLLADKVGGSKNIFATNSKEERYTLNSAGRIYFSYLAATKCLDEVVKKSMHSIFNLRPVCGPCNSALRNSNIFADQ